MRVKHFQKNKHLVPRLTNFRAGLSASTSNNVH